MKLKELRDWIDTLPKEMLEKFDVVSSKEGTLSSEKSYRLDMPIMRLGVDVDENEVLLFIRGDDEDLKAEPEPNVDVLFFSPDWSQLWCIGWIDKAGKWWCDPKDEPVRCLTDEKCKVLEWKPMPDIPEPWATLWEENPY